MCTFAGLPRLVRCVLPRRTTGYCGAVWIPSVASAASTILEVGRAGSSCSWDWLCFLVVSAGLSKDDEALAGLPRRFGFISAGMAASCSAACVSVVLS